MKAAPLTTTPRTARPIRNQALAALMGAALLSTMAPGAAKAQSYPVYTITSLPAISSVTAFNDSGLVLGRGFVPCSGICTLSDVPVLYDTRSATVTALGSGFGSGTQFDALNARGQLAGTTIAYNASGATVRSVVLRQPDGTLTTLAAPALQATQTSGLRVRALNANGQMALEHTDGLDAVAPMCGNYQGWTGNGASAAGWQPWGPAGAVVRPTAINAGGVGVGAAVAAASCGGLGGGFRAVMTQANGALADLHGSIPGSFSRANAINDLGYAVGDHDTGARTLPDSYNPQGVPIVRTAVWNTATRTWYDIGPANSLSRLNAVNNRGEVVGSASTPVAAGQPFSYPGARAMLGNLATHWPMVDLNTLLANNSEGWVLQEAVAINASGQILARGTSPGGSGYVLLVPVTAPVNPYATVPSAPASLAVSQLTASTARLSWTNTARNATRLVVERCRGSRCTGFIAIATLPADTASYGETGLARHTSYRWRVRAGNASGLSAAGNVVTATTLR